MIFKRDIKLDFFRFFILSFMIEGHAIREFLRVDLKKSLIFSIHEFFHSVTAPAFLFLSGYLFWMSFEKKGIGAKNFFQKLKRYIFIILVGYMLHLPFFSLKKTVKLWGTGIEKSFLNFDVLQCIGGSLLIALFLGVIFKENFKYVSIALFVAFYSGFYLIDCKNCPLFLKSLFSPEISNFPIFYYGIYFYFGVIVSSFKLKVKPFYGVIFLMASTFLVIFYGDTYKPIVDLLKLLFFVSLFFNLKEEFILKSKALKIFSEISRESLFIYVFHLILIYGSVLGKGLSFYYGNRLSLIRSLFLMSFVFVLTYALAYTIRSLRKRKIYFNIVKYSFYLWFVLNLLKREF